MKPSNIIDLQKLCLTKMDHHYKQFIKTQEDFSIKIKTYIDSRTGQNFKYTQIDNSIIYHQDSYKIMFSIINQEWSLYNNELIYKSNDLNEVIYQYNIVTNRLAIVISDYNLDSDIELITNLMEEYKMEE